MNLLKKLLIGSVLLVVLAVGAAAVALLTLDPNNYKDWIADKVRAQTGRELAIEGDIQLSYYPWLGLDVSKISLSNASGFGEAPFLQTETIKVRAKLLPLLRKELEMDTLILHGATLNLAKNKDGVSNWDDLVKPAEGEPKATSGQPPFAALVLGGIDIKDASISWVDQQQDVNVQVNGIKINTGELQLGAPILVEAGLNVAANKPALTSSVGFKGTVAYEDGGDLLMLKPMTLEAVVKGKAIPGGETAVKLGSEIQVDMANYVARVNALTLTAFDSEITGQFEAANYQTGKPLVNGELNVSGKDLPGLFKIFEIEPLATQLAGIEQKNFSLKTRFDADLDRNDMSISPLAMNILGNQVDAEVVARNIQSSTPAAKGMIKASGPNLPILISLAAQLQGMDKNKLAGLSKQLKSAPKSFSIETDFDLDLKAGTITIPALAVKALGTETSGNISGKQLQSDDPALQGKLSVKGKDLPTLVRIAAAYSGDGKQDLSVLSKQLKSVPADFSVASQFDSGAGGIEISKLDIKALGLNSNGKLRVKNAMSDKPALSGELKASGPDLPLLLLIAGSMQGKDSALAGLGKDLSKVKDRSFQLTSNFDTDFQSGKIDLPDFSFKSLGLTVNGNLKGKDIQSGGNLSGKLVISSKKPKPLMTALGQADLAQVLKSIDINSGINGNADRFQLKPMSLAAVFSGKQIPNSPVTLKVDADSNVDMKKEQFELSGLKVSGLGLDVTGNVNASKFKTAPEFAGNIDVAPFNLRQFLQSLNQDVPKTADPKVLQNLSFTSTFSGTAGSMALKDLKAQLDDTRLQGDINLVKFSPLNLEFGLGMDKLNLDRYLPPEAKKQKQAATPEAVAAGVATEIPVETLRALKIKGDFAMGQFVIANAKLSDLELSIRANEGDIKLTPINARLYGGSYKGDIDLNAQGKKPKLKTNSRLTGVQVEPLLKDVTGSADAVGQANINLALNTSGSNTDQMKRRLSGNGEIKFLDGIFRGVDVAKVLRQIEIMYESKRFGGIDTKGETRFQSLTGKLKIKNGVVDNDDMLMLANGFRVAGKGMMVNLNDETWKYNLNVIVDPASATRGEERFNIGGYDILIKCRGKVVDKKCLPDLESMIAALAEDTIKEKIGEAIGIDLPGVTSKKPAPAKDSKKKSKKKKQQQKQATPEQIIQEELGKGLKKLLDF